MYYRTHHINKCGHVHSNNDDDEKCLCNQQVMYRYRCIRHQPSMVGAHLVYICDGPKRTGTKQCRGDTWCNTTCNQTHTAKIHSRNGACGRIVKHQHLHIWHYMNGEIVASRYMLMYAKTARSKHIHRITQC